MGFTTIQLSVETREKLSSLKEYPRETYDEVISKMVEIVRRVADEGNLSQQALEDIRISNEQSNAGKGFSTREVLKRLGA